MLARFPIWNQQTTFGIEQTSLASQMNSVGPMPPSIIDRAIKYPITLVKYADVKSKFEQAYDRVMMLLTPGGNYQFAAQTLLGATFLCRRKA
jgi:hypothetical protein